MPHTPYHIAVVLAGGTGSRFGADIPKQFLTCAGKHLIEYAIDAFNQHALIREIFVVVHPDWVAFMRTIAQARQWEKLRCILPGGATRSESSLAAIRAAEACEAKGNKNIYLLFHDAVRPLLSSALITRCCEALQRCQALTAAVPAVDTICEVEGSRIVATPPRARLRSVQTPQAFRLDIIAKAYEQALSDPAFQATDDAGVVLRYLPNEPVCTVEGETENIKLTHPSDLPIVAHYLGQRKP